MHGMQWAWGMVGGAEMGENEVVCFSLEGTWKGLGRRFRKGFVIGRSRKWVKRWRLRGWGVRMED